jgi:hypothetical protein
MKRYHFFLLPIFFALSISAHAEMEKFAHVREGQMCFYWWPKLPAVDGWHHEREDSYLYSANAQAPDGYTFTNAETVIYAKALYKPKIPETKSLEILIRDDKQEFLSGDQSLNVTQVADIITGDGQSLKSFTFFPQEKGNWEQVTYGEESDFYLIFTISSRSKDGYTEALDAYKQFIGRYKAKP